MLPKESTARIEVMDFGRIQIGSIPYPSKMIACKDSINLEAKEERYFLRQPNHSTVLYKKILIYFPKSLPEWLSTFKTIPALLLVIQL